MLPEGSVKYPAGMVEATDGTLFKAEYERELETWLRRRFGWLLGAILGWELLSLLIVAAMALAYKVSERADLSKIEAKDPAAAAELENLREAGPEFLTLTMLGTILVLAIAARAFITVRRRLETREQTLQATNWLILQIGAITFGTDLAMRILWPGRADVLGTAGLPTILFLHLVPSLILPWTPRESMRPMYPLASMLMLELVVLKIAGIVGTSDIVQTLLLAPVALAPGLAVSWYRIRVHRRRFDRQMVTKGFFAMRRELSQAKAVQMALFPKPVRDGGHDFDFAYSPANEVGGDFIHASVDERGRLDIVLMDVTGHGLASALTVARLSGEVERLLAEDPDMTPGTVLRSLNRYVALTLARHSVFLTAISVQVDPVHGTVRYVNAGHPPAWVRRGDGRVERFDSTTFLLGAVPDADFDADETEIVLGPDDTLVLVTDGVHEAPDRAGRQFGIDRIAEFLARPAPKEGLSRALTHAVEQWRGKVGDDDVLVATVRTPKATAPLPRTASHAEDIERGISLGLAAAPPEHPAPAAGVTA